MTGDSTYPRGDAILARVLSGDEWGSGIANDLLKEFFSGYPIDKLTPLLHSDNEAVVASGAWIASELTTRARPILSELLPLYNHPNTRVRYYAVQLALTAATEGDGEVIARAIELVADPEEPVRRNCFALLVGADSAQLTASLPCITDRQITALLEWVLEVENGSRDSDEIESRLRDSAGLGRLFAVVAAARIYERSPLYLQFAASLGESDAQSLAASELQWLSKLQEQAERRREQAEHRSG